MAAERFRLAAKIDVRHVPFKEGGLVQVMNGNVDFYFIPLAAAASALHSDKLTILVVSSPKRVSVLPNTPSVVEAGYPDAVFRFWNGLSAPAKTPPDVVKKLHDVTEQALKTPPCKKDWPSSASSRRRSVPKNLRNSSKTISPRRCNSPKKPISSRSTNPR